MNTMYILMSVLVGVCFYVWIMNKVLDEERAHDIILAIAILFALVAILLGIIWPLVMVALSIVVPMYYYKRR